MTLQETLAAIDDWIAAHRPDYHAELQSPASDASLDALRGCVDQDLPEDFLSLYRWHDGQDPQSLTSLTGNQMFMSSYDVVDVKDMLDGMIGYDFEDPETWRRGWVPFLSNGGGSYLCIDLEARSGAVGQMIEFWKGEAGRPVVYGSVRAWADALLASMRDGTYEAF